MRLEKQRSTVDDDTPEATKEELVKYKKETASLKKQIDEVKFKIDNSHIV